MTEDHNDKALQDLSNYLENRVKVLRKFNSKSQGNSFEYICMEDFVLRHGHGMEGGCLLDVHPAGEAQHCFANSQRLALANPNLTYFEGFATGIIPVHHAWCCDEQGRVIDVTWDQSPGKAYFGAPIQTSYLERLLRQHHRWHSLLNDWENDFPLLSGAHPASMAVESWPKIQATLKGPSM